MARQAYWSNSDGLYVGFGTHTVDGNTASALNSYGETKEARIHIKGTEILDTAVADDVKANGIRFPANTLLVSATLQVYTAFAGSSSVLDIGTFGTDDWAAIADAGVHTVAVATLVDNYIVACTGASLGTAVAEEFVIAATYDTAAFTAGDAILTVLYIPQLR